MRSFQRHNKNRVLRPVQQGLSGAHQRCLLRTLYLMTGLLLTVFAGMQLFAGQRYAAIVRAGVAGALLCAH